MCFLVLRDVFPAIMIGKFIEQRTSQRVHALIKTLNQEQKGWFGMQKTSGFPDLTF